MYPIIDLGLIQIPSYGLMVFVGLIAYVIYLYISLKKIENKDDLTIKQTIIVSALSFVVMYISAAFFDALFHSISEKRLVFSGITWEGGVIGGFTAFIVLSHMIVKKERGKEIELFSLVIPGLVLAHAFGRVGCFLGGCCFGNITEGPLGVVFPNGSVAASVYPNTLTGEGSFPVLPTQLFEVVFELILFIFLIVFRKKIKNNSLVIYLVFYSIFRFILEFFRGDNRGETGLYISPSQLMSIILFVCGILIYLFQSKKVFKKLNDKCILWQEMALNGCFDKVDILPEKKQKYKELELLYQLKLTGAITEEEYNQKKEKFLNEI